MSQDDAIIAPAAKMFDEAMLIRYLGSIQGTVNLLKADPLKLSVKLVINELAEKGWASSHCRSKSLCR